MTVIDIVGPAIGAGVFVVVMSLVPEPTRRTLNAILVAGASGVYLSGGFGAWELLYPVMATPVTFRALRSHRYIGIAWLMLPHGIFLTTCGRIRFGPSCETPRSDALSLIR